MFTVNETIKNICQKEDDNCLYPEHINIDKWKFTINIVIYRRTGLN